MNEKCQLYFGDCIERLKAIVTKSVDLVLTDPPYGIGINKMSFVTSGAIKVGGAYRNDYSNCSTDWDSTCLSEEQLKEIFRVSKNQVIFGANHYSDILPVSRGWIVWDKRCEEKYSNDFADCELIWTSFNTPERVFRYLWSGMLQENMGKKEKRVHPTQKPLPLMEWLIKNNSKEGDVILDPFMGSGTTGIAALKLQRDFVGIEIDPNYFVMAKQRIEPWLQQQRLVK